MRFIQFFSLVLFLSGFSLYGQHSEIGINLGVSYYIGEINPELHVINKVRPSAGLFYRMNTSKRYSLRFGVNYASLAASDAMSASRFADYRGLSYGADLYEGYGILEFNFIPYQLNNYATSDFTPYVFIGLAGFYVRPNVGPDLEKFIDETIDELAAPSVPFGLGIKFNFIDYLGIGVEWGMRKTFTDEIDGLPPTYADGYQLSNTQNNDWYSILAITLNYKFLTKRDRCPGAIN